MKLIRFILCLTLLLGHSFISSATNVDERILNMQMKFVKCVEINDTDGAYRITDSLKAFALKSNRLNVYYYCFNNLVIMECSRGKFHHAIHISQHILEDIEKSKAFSYMPEYYKAMSTIHSARGDHKVGLEYLLKAEEKSEGKDKNIYVRLAKLLNEMEQPEEAIKWANKAIDETNDEASIIKSNGIYYKMLAYYNMENKDSFDVYYNKYVEFANNDKCSPELLAYLPYLKAFMDGDYKKATKCTESIKSEKDRLEFLINAYEKDRDIEMAYKTQRQYIKFKDSINEAIIHEDLLAMNHSSEMAEKNNELAKHRYTNMILAIAIAVFCIVSFVIISILRSRFYKKMKSKNEQLTNAMNEVEKSARIRRAMIEDIKEKSNQPQNILRTYSRIIVNPDFNITEEGRQDVLPNIRNSVNILKNLSSSVVHTYKNDELAQQVAANGKTKIENSRNELMDSINSLLGFLDIMESGGYNIDAPQMSEIAMQMHLDMKSITILFDTLLDMSYYDSFDELPLEDKVSINEVCRTMIKEFIQRRKDDVAITFNTQLDDSVTINTYYSALYKMLKYTLDNADKFTAKGTINVDCSKKGNKILISFTDTGCGIEKCNQDLVFNRFFRSASQYHGVGLGLPICRKIGSLINARIYLDKEYNNGSRFIIEIEN